MSRPRFVLFDLGKVLVDWNPAFLYRRLIADPDRLRFFLEEVCPMSWHLLHDQGHSMDETIPARIALFPDYAELIRAWKTRWREMFCGEVAGSFALARALRDRLVPLYALTNLPAEKEDETFDLYPGLRALFDDVIVSGVEHLAKPDPAIFHLTLVRMGARPQEVFFTDDNRANIDAAKRLGFQTHLFEGAAGLEAALRERQLLD